MTSREREPTRDELLAMAYADGELAEEARRGFEARLATEPQLLREVAELKKLEVMARRTAPPEPMDFEWRRLEKEAVHAGGTRLAFTLMAVGAVGGSSWITFELMRSEMGAVSKTFLALTLVGLVVRFLLTLRARLRTLPYDPYTEVER